MRKDDGGPAFPVSDAFVDMHEGGHGMSLRDYFAGQALVGLIAEGANRTADTEALLAYDQADAMLTARTQEETDGSE